MQDLNYDMYRLKFRELAIIILRSLAIIFCTGVLFFRSIWGVIALLPYFIVFIRNEKRFLIKQRRWKLNMEFKDGLNSLSAAMEAGYSAENAMAEALQDLRLMYQEQDLIVLEFSAIVKKLKNHMNIEAIFLEFAERSGVEDIYSFAEVFSTAKRSGGDIIKIIANTKSTIGDKIDVKREIQTMIASRQYELKIMKVIPYGLLCYLWLFSPGLLEPLYQGLSGRIMMSVILVFYYFLCRLADRFMYIEL